MGFIYIADGIDDVLAAHLNQYADAWSGVAGKGQPFNAVAVNDPINFAISARNLDPTNSRTLQLLKADGTVLFQCDASGVKVSPDGTVASVPATLTATQTFTNKTFTNPHMTTPVVDSGGLTVTAGGLAVGGAVTGTGTGGFGAWTVWAPSLTQGVAVAFTTNLARYVQVGKICIVQLQITATAAGTLANDITVGGFPVVPFSANADLAVGTFRFDGAAIRIGAVCMVTGSTFKFQIDNQAGFLGTAPSVALANGSVLTFQAAFETT